MQMIRLQGPCASAHLGAHPFLSPSPLGDLGLGSKAEHQEDVGGPGFDLGPCSSQLQRGIPPFPNTPTPSAPSSSSHQPSLTFRSQVELSKLAEDTLSGEVHVAGGQAGVVAQV